MTSQEGVLLLYHISGTFCSPDILGLQLLYSCIRNYLVDQITGQILGPQQRMSVNNGIERNH